VTESTNPARDPRGASPPSVPVGAAAEPPRVDGIADGIEHRLDPRYLTLQQRRGWIRAIAYPLFWLVIVSGAVAFFAFRPFLIRPAYVAWALWSLGYAIWCVRRPVIAYRHASYRLDEHGIEIREGIIWRRVINVPRSRVQHIDVSQGPFERRHGIGTLSIYTAGVSHAMVTLPGLDHARALRIRDYLLPERGDTGV
jgi:membrane protein YdbS with pleckstrin-like domain